MQMEVQDRYLVTSALAVECSEVEPIREGQQQERVFGGWQKRVGNHCIGFFSLLFPTGNGVPRTLFVSHHRSARLR